MGEVFKILSEKKEHTEIEGESLAYLEKFVKIDPKKNKKIEKDVRHFGHLFFTPVYLDYIQFRDHDITSIY